MKKETYQEFIIRCGEWNSAEQISMKFNINEKTICSCARRNKIRLVSTNDTKWKPKLAPFFSVFVHDV